MDTPITPKHYNNHILASIAVRTTGPNPDIHEINSICVLPVDITYNWDSRFGLLDVGIRPEKKNYEITDADYMESVANGMPKEKFLMVFHSWVDKLHLNIGKKIIPLVFNYGYYAPFLVNLFGYLDYSTYFTIKEYRDPMQDTCYLNDRAGALHEQVMFPKRDIGSICNRLKIDKGLNTPLEKARVTLELYKSLVFRHLL